MRERERERERERKETENVEGERQMEMYRQTERDRNIFKVCQNFELYRILTHNTAVQPCRYFPASAHRIY